MAGYTSIIPRNVSGRETLNDKGSYKSRWVIVIVVVIAAIAHSGSGKAAMTPGVQPQGRRTSAAIASGWSPWYAFRPISPVQAATAVEQAVPRYLTGLGTLPPLILLRCAAAWTVN